MNADPHFWLGYLAANIRAATRERADDAKARLTDALQRFVDSPACEPELRTILQAKSRPAAERLNDEYDISDDYKPCGNPECRAPLPKRDKRTYCDRLCKSIAQEYVAEEEQAEHDAAFRERNPNYDRCPF